MFSKLRLIAIPAFILIMAGSSFGIQQVQVVPYSSLSVPGTLTLNFDKFDPALGILQQVILTLDVDPLQAGSASYTNSPNAQADAIVTLKIKGEIEAGTMMANSPLNASLMTAEKIASDTLAPGEMLQVVGDPVSGSNQDMLSDPPADLSEYIGIAGNPGSFSVALKTTAMFTITIDGGGFGQLNTTPGTSSGKVTVTYIYIPEPASLAMLGLGSVVLLRRRASR